MNILDTTPQLNARRGDAQLPGSGPERTSDAARQQGGLGEASFSRAFDDISQTPTGNPTPAGDNPAARPDPHNRTPAVSSPESLALADASERDAIGDFLNSVASPDAGSPDARSAEASGSAPQQTIGTQIASLLAALMPGQANAGEDGSAMPGQAAEGRAATMVAGAEDGASGAPQGGLLTLSVKLQETHFKPVVQGLGSKLVAPVPPAGSLPLGAQDGELAVALGEGLGEAPDGELPAGGPPSAVAPGRSSSLALHTGPDGTAPGKGQAADQALRSAEHLSPEAGKADRQAAGVVAGEPQRHDAALKTEGDSAFPAPMLNRIAQAVVAEARSIPPQAPVDTATMPPMLTTARASEAAIRILHIQLSPADLGLVTVRMKLSGDSLELNVQVESEKTAAILRVESEKLSGLLRNVGYKPDIINIHTGQPDAALLDNYQSQRQQSQAFSQQEAFQQGASGQGERPRKRETHHENDVDQTSGPQAEDAVRPSRSLGGIYV